MFGISLGKVVGAGVSAIVGATIAVPIALSGVTSTGAAAAGTPTEGVQSAVIDACTIGTGSAVDSGFVKSAVSSGALSLPVVHTVTSGGSGQVAQAAASGGLIGAAVATNVAVGDVLSNNDVDVNVLNDNQVLSNNDTDILSENTLEGSSVDLSALTGLLN